MEDVGFNLRDQQWDSLDRLKIAINFGLIILV